MPLKKCEVCGSEFQARLSKIRTCGISCRNQLISSEKSAKYQKVNQCVVCKKHFSVGAVDANKQTCSTECQYRLGAIKTKKASARNCAICGTEFFARKSQIATGGGKCCSVACADKFRYTRVDIPCEACGVNFLIPKSRIGMARFCSKKCARAVMPASPRNRVAKQCKCCAKDFEVVACKEDRKPYCSMACARKTMKGEGSPHWKGVGVYEYFIDENGLEKKRKARDVNTAKTAKRNAGAKQATPAWANQSKIRAIYKIARVLTETTGIPHHVDHVFPLNGKTVSGLHTEANLQVLPWLENLRRGNKSCPDTP